MTLALPTAVRSNMATQILNDIDAGASNGVLKIYSGTRPASGGAETTILAQLTLSDPAGTVSNGVLTFSAITGDTSADATGTASWARIEDSDGNWACDLDVTGSGGGGDIELDSVSITAGQEVNITSGSITIGNA